MESNADANINAEAIQAKILALETLRADYKQRIQELQEVVVQAIDAVYNNPSMREDDRNLQKGMISSARVAMEDPKREVGYVEVALERARKDYKELLEARSVGAAAAAAAAAAATATTAVADSTS